jgi:hypothetical protein
MDSVGGDFEGLTEPEKARIRLETRYALLAAQEVRKSDANKTSLGRLLGFLSNGFVLLLFGSLISSFLVPHFQKKAEKRSQQVAMMKECLSEFLLYSNSLWREYYASLPLTQRMEIDEATYLDFVAKITEIKLKRYDSYARVQALMVVFQLQNTVDNDKPLRNDLNEFAVKVNSVSAEIDRWLTGLYCTPFARDRSPCNTFDPRFDPYSTHLEIKRQVVAIGNEDTDALALNIVQQINLR